MTFPFAARTNASNMRAASMEPLEVLLSTHNPQVDKLLGGGFPCKGFVEMLLLHGLHRSLETKTGVRCRALHSLVLLEMLSYSAFAQLRLPAYR